MSPCCALAALGFRVGVGVIRGNGFTSVSDACDVPLSELDARDIAGGREIVV